MKGAIVLNSHTTIAEIEEKYIIAADRGYEEVLAQGKKPNIVIGDFDSSIEPSDIDVVKLQIEKDDTDSQAAIDYAYNYGINEVVIYGALGGRADHELCNFSLLAQAHNLNMKAKIKEPDVEIFYYETGKVSFDINKGATFSILAFGGDLLMSNGENTKYPINNLFVTKYELGRSVSNIALDSHVSFVILKGSALLFIYNK